MLRLRSDRSVSPELMLIHSGESACELQPAEPPAEQPTVVAACSMMGL